MTTLKATLNRVLDFAGAYAAKHKPVHPDGAMICIADGRPLSLGDLTTLMLYAAGGAGQPEARVTTDNGYSVVQIKAAPAAPREVVFGVGCKDVTGLQINGINTAVHPVPVIDAHSPGATFKIEAAPFGERPAVFITGPELAGEIVIHYPNHYSAATAAMLARGEQDHSPRRYIVQVPKGYPLDYDTFGSAVRAENAAERVREDGGTAHVIPLYDVPPAPEAEGELAAVAKALGPTVEFMDPPDGGSVSLAEQVARLKQSRDDLLTLAQKSRDNAPSYRALLEAALLELAGVRGDLPYGPALMTADAVFSRLNGLKTALDQIEGKLSGTIHFAPGALEGAVAVKIEEGGA